jgi:hypothetical protein
MERIETSKLNRGLKDILGQVAAGKSFILTRYGKDVAFLTQADEGYKKISVIKPRSARDELLSEIRGDD